MTDMLQPSGDLREATTGAGARLRQAREAQGLSLDDLAVALKVTVHKLSALEAGRFDELHDATFVRALALAVCRHLKVDPQPVLALLPRREVSALTHVTRGIDEPFRGRSDAGPLATGVAALRSPAVLAVLAVLLLGAALLWLLPANSWQRVSTLWPSAASTPWSQPDGPPDTPGSTPAGALDDVALPSMTVPDAAASVAAAIPAPSAASDATTVAAVDTPASAVDPIAAIAAADALRTATASGASLSVSVSADAWVEVVDATGAVLQRGTMHKGDDKVLAGTPPLRVRLGNATAVSLRFRGQPVDVNAVARYGRASLELK